MSKHFTTLRCVKGHIDSSDEWFEESCRTAIEVACGHDFEIFLTAKGMVRSEGCYGPDGIGDDEDMTLTQARKIVKDAMDEVVFPDVTESFLDEDEEGNEHERVETVVSGDEIKREYFKFYREIYG